jgi:hypothetical protein
VEVLSRLQRLLSRSESIARPGPAGSEPYCSFHCRLQIPIRLCCHHSSLLQRHFAWSTRIGHLKRAALGPCCFSLCEAFGSVWTHTVYVLHCPRDGPPPSQTIQLAPRDSESSRPCKAPRCTAKQKSTMSLSQRLHVDSPGKRRKLQVGLSFNCWPCSLLRPREPERDTNPNANRELTRLLFQFFFIFSCR